MEVDRRSNEGTQLTRWLAKARGGDKEAFDHLCATDLWQRWLILIASSLPRDLRSKVDPEDVLQETLAQAWRDLGGLERVSTRGFHRWTASIVRNRVRDLIRYHARAKRDVAREEALPSSSRLAPGDEHTPSKSAARHEQFEKIAAVLDELRESYRTVIVHRILEGYTTKEVAEMTDKAPHNVRVTLQRALAKLRELLDQHGIESTVFRPP